MKITLLLVCLLAVHFTSAQEGFMSSAGEATGSGGSVSYSVGQLIYTTLTGTGSVSQGVQQAFEFQTLSNPELTTVHLSAVTYPNPTSDFVILKISDNALDDLSYKLISVSGKVLSEMKIINAQTQIYMQQLALGIYILKVNQNGQELKTFKIIKK